jgi:23S rRNA (uracil1939-C5)-methyltransferase
VTVDLVITGLAHLGDGIAEVDGKTVYVRGALPGERVRARLEGERAQAVEIVEASPDRQPPVCRHFLTCGGCALQHMAARPYLDWKRSLVAAALGARGVDHAVEPAVAIAPGTRRRATFAARRTRNTVLFGFHGLRSGVLVDIAECPVLEPAIEAAVPGLRALMDGRLSRRGEAVVQVTASRSGLDVTVAGASEVEGAQELARLAGAAEALDLARLTWNGETIAERRAPVQLFDGIAVAPPPGAFLQAAVPAETALARLVVDGVGEAAPVADLFCGVGTFSLPLARTRAVHAVEADAAALAALEAGANGAAGLKPVTTERRDLFRRPLLAHELGRYEAVVFDPPRAGAKAQAEELAASPVPVVVAVSCSPATFARDARILVDGGYRLERVTPVDQFLFSPHVELVAVFRRD